MTSEKPISPTSDLLRGLGEFVRGWLRESAQKIKADEASLWIISEARDCLIMVLNSGPEFEAMELRIAQPLSEGIISAVFCEGKPILENSIFGKHEHSPRVDIAEGQSTHYIAAVPFHYADQLVGVVSAVQITTSPFEARGAAEWGLAEDSMQILEELADKIAATVSAPTTTEDTDLTVVASTVSPLAAMADFSQSQLNDAREKLGETFRPVLASTATAILADEASLWLKAPDRDSLVMVLNGNLAAAHMELQAEQPLETGLVSRVYKRVEPFIDPHSVPIRDHSKKIDIEYSQITHYMAIVPVIVKGVCGGVVSAVKFPKDGDRIRKASEWNFSKDALARLTEVADRIATALEAA